jgi:hypothetical protein
MQRQTILRLSAIVALAGLAACSGGSTSSPTPQNPGIGGGGTPPQASTMMDVTIDGSAQNFEFPATSGFQERVSFLKRNVSAPVTVKITASNTAPPGFSAERVRRALASGEIALLYYNVFTFTSPLDVTFYPPGFTLTLPNSVPTTTGQFYYGISPLPTSPSSGYATPNPYAGIVLRTEGPATVSGQTLTFAPSDNPVTLVAGNSYLVVFYRTCTLVSGATSC